MFDLSNMRLNAVDQLRVWKIYETQCELTARDGRVYPKGAEFYFDHAVVDVPGKRAVIHGTGPDGDELVFESRDSAHKEWFVETGLEWRPRAKKLPPASAEEIANWQEWLARQEGFEEASRLLAGHASRGDWGASRRDGEVLRRAALRLKDTHPDIAQKLADRSLDFYHAWMAQATSGGEGSAMQYEIRDELAEMRALAKGRSAT